MFFYYCIGWENVFVRSFVKCFWVFRRRWLGYGVWWRGCCFGFFWFFFWCGWWLRWFGVVRSIVKVWFLLSLVIVRLVGGIFGCFGDFWCNSFCVVCFCCSRRCGFWFWRYWGWCGSVFFSFCFGIGWGNCFCWCVWWSLGWGCRFVVVCGWWFGLCYCFCDSCRYCWRVWIDWGCSSRCRILFCFVVGIWCDCWWVCCLVIVLVDWCGGWCWFVFVWFCVVGCGWCLVLCIGCGWWWWSCWRDGVIWYVLVGWRGFVGWCFVWLGWDWGLWRRCRIFCYIVCGCIGG